MEKYSFDRKLQEAVLKRMGRKQSIITINGEERKVRCPVFIKTDTSVIPCLVKEDSKTGNTGYTVVAVSFDELDAEEKNWICIQSVFLERAIEFFMENNQMESMTGDCRCAERLPDTRDSGFDFETKNALVEIKVPLIVPNGTVSCIWKSFHQAVKQMIGYCNSSYVKKKGKRIALLIIYQYDTRQIQSMIDGSIEQLEKVAKTGIEFWIAETKTEEDGISLLGYWDYTDKIL